MDDIELLSQLSDASNGWFHLEISHWYPSLYVYKERRGSPLKKSNFQHTTVILKKPLCLSFNQGPTLNKVKSSTLPLRPLKPPLCSSFDLDLNLYKFDIQQSMYHPKLMVKFWFEYKWFSIEYHNFKHWLQLVWWPSKVKIDIIGIGMARRTKWLRIVERKCLEDLACLNIHLFCSLHHNRTHHTQH